MTLSFDPQIMFITCVKHVLLTIPSKRQEDAASGCTWEAFWEASGLPESPIARILRRDALDEKVWEGTGNISAEVGRWMCGGGWLE